MKSKASDHVEQCVYDNSLFGINNFINNHKERNYVRSIKF